jgi:Tol biopolymer transport system component/DNA-binding winged helix-turn-helix (wHTH) protein
MYKQNKPGYEFGPFHLDVEERLLLRDGRVVPLPPKVFDTLLALVANRGRILGKEELMQTLWPETFVEESNLTQNISQIRRALGEGEYIETIPKRGYRFVAEVQAVALNEQDSAIAARAGAGESRPVGGKEWLNGSLAAGNMQPALGGDSTAVMGREEGLSSPQIVQRPLDPRRVLISVALLLISLAVLAFALFSAYRRSNNQAKTAFQQITPVKVTTSGKAMRMAISRDGKYVAYVAQDGDLQSLGVRQVATTSGTEIVPPAEVRYTGLTFSLDDNFIYYVSQPRGEMLSKLYQVPVLGGTPREVISDVDSPISFSPNGQYLAFVRNYPAEREVSLITAKVDGTEERKLATRKRPEMLSLDGPAWSPNGRLIACAVGVVAGADSTMQVLVVNLADGSEQPIGSQTWTAIGQVAWLGDGSGVVFNGWRRTSAVYGDQLWLLTFPPGEARRITNDMTSYEGVSVAADSGALVSRRTDRVSRIWVVPATDGALQTARATQIQSGFGDNYSERFGLDWTPDGRLVYASHASGNLDIWITSADSRQQWQQRQLTRDPLTDIMPVASPDGRYIVFVSERSGAGNLWRMDTDGGNPKQLTHGKGDALPTVSPDGKWVVYSSLSGGKWALWKVPMEGGEPVPLTENGTTRPVISPDGKWIACQYQGEKDNKVKIALLPFDGGEPKVIEQMTLPEFGLYRWSPDSRALTYIVTRQGVSNLWSRPIGGGEPKQLTDFTSDQIFRFAWSRDGKALACERGMAINDVILLRSGKAE